MKTIAGIILALGISGSALASPVTFNLNYSTVSGTGTATGTFTIDSSNLGPNVTLGGFADLSGLISFQLTVSGLPTSPSSTTFAAADLDAWIYSTGPSGNLTDVNFFMPAPNVNGDGYAILGTDPFELSIFDGAANDSPAVAVFAASPAQAPAAPVPATSPWALALLAMMLSLVAWRRRLWSR